MAAEVRAIAVSVMIVVVFAFLAGYAAGQRQVPTQTVGLEELLRSLDLSNELDFDRKAAAYACARSRSSRAECWACTTMSIARPSPMSCRARSPIIRTPNQTRSQKQEEALPKAGTDTLGGKHRQGAGDLGCRRYSQTLTNRPEKISHGLNGLNGLNGFKSAQSVQSVAYSPTTNRPCETYFCIN